MHARQDSHRAALDCRLRSSPRASRPSASRRRPCATRTRGAAVWEAGKRCTNLVLLSKGAFRRGRDSVDVGVFAACFAYSTFTAMQRCTLFRTARRELTGILMYGTVSVCGVGWVHDGCEAALSWLHCPAVACDIQHTERLPYACQIEYLPNHANGQRAAAHLAPGREHASCIGTRCCRVCLLARQHVHAGAHSLISVCSAALVQIQL